MERQSSFGSQGSGKSSSTKLIEDAKKHGDSVESQNSNNGFTTALFGVLFTLAKEKYSDSWKIAILTVVVDFLLIMAIMFNLEYPWAVDPHSGIFKFFYMLEIHKPLSTAGYKFYVIVFYLLSAMLYVSVAICVWVAWCFKNDSFPYLWPIKFVRVVASLFFGMLYIAALNIFLVIIECAPYHGVWVQHVWHKECFAMPHLIHVVFSLFSCVTFAVAALLLVIADHELQPMSRSLLAAPHSMTELKAQLAKTVITVVDVLLWGFPKVQGVTFALCTCATFYFHLKQLPYYTSWMNSFRLCFFAVHAWVGVHLAVLVFTVKADKVKKGSLGFMLWDIHDYETAKAITSSMLYGLPVVFFGAGLLGAIRLYYFFRIALKFQLLQQQPNLYSKRVHRFNDDKEVEICSRIARVWDEEGNVDQQCLDLAETILRAGIQQFPKSPYLHIVYANLLIECRQQLQSGWSQLEEARRMPLNLSYRFSIFTREQEHKQKAAVSSSGESAADLVSYVEFQRNYRMIQSYHKAALVAMREFWRLLLYDAVNMNSLTSAFRKIEHMERMADKTYKLVLERYPKAVKLLRSYALFLETVKNDPWTAAQFYSEAEKQEEALENAEHDLAGEKGLTMRNSAIVTINAMGIIQMANKHAIKMLGYSKGELEGKNVSCLMPQPFSARHNTYMRNYVTTGKAKILDTLREVVALHRDRYVFPIKILVSKSQGNGADAIFMGLLKEVEADPNQIKAWLMPNGVILCADLSFTDYAGWAPNDLIGKPISSIAVDPVAVNNLLDKAVKATEEDLKEGDLQEDILLMHKYAEDVPVTVRVELGGTSDQRLLVLNMTRAGEVVPTMVLDHHGRVLFTNQALCSLLGTKPKDMRGRDLGTLLPQPFGYLHHRWIKEAEVSISNKPPPSSCRAGMVHSMVSSNGVHVPVRMVITSRELAGGVHVNIVRATRVTVDDALVEQRLNITTDQHGHIISVSSAHHNAHATSSMGGAPLPNPSVTTPGLEPAGAGGPRPQVFGYPPENLVGRKLYEAIDIFQDWHSQGHSVMHAMKALAQHSSARPGSAWRVGVLPHYLSLETEKAAQRMGRHSGDTDVQGEDQRASLTSDLRSLSLSHRRSMHRNATLLRQSLPKWRAAIMQVMGPEHTATGTHYTVKLWRPELLTGVLELNEKMTVVKADSAAGLIFGVPSYTMSQQPLSRFLKLGPPGSNSTRKPAIGGDVGGLETQPSTAPSAGGAAGGPLITKESLMGNHHVKGGMKGGKLAHKSGPRRIFEARHADGMPLQISFQVALKNGTSATRLMAAIKPLNLIKGNVAVLYSAMRGEDLDHYTVEDFGSRSFHRLRTHASQRNALAAPSNKHLSEVTGAAVRKQSTSRLIGGPAARPASAAPSAAAAAAAAAAALPLGKAPSGLSAKATAVAPGMSSARTLGAATALGSGTTRSDEQTTALAKLTPGAGFVGDERRPGGGAADPPVTASTDFAALATARNIDLKFGAPTPRGKEDGPDANGAAEGKAKDGGAGDGNSPDGPAKPERSGSGIDKDDGEGQLVSGSVAGSDANRPPISDDSAMVRPGTRDQLREKAPEQKELDPSPAVAEGPEGAQEKQQPPEGEQGPPDDTESQSQSQFRQLQRSSQEVAGEEGGKEGEAGAGPNPHHHHHHHHHHGRYLSRKFQTREWDHVMHVDPEQVPIPHDADYDIEHHWGDEKDMTVSSSSSSHDDDGSDSESDCHVGRNTEGAADKMTRAEALQRKKTMAAMEPGERAQYVKGVRRVKEWLASGYFFDRRDADPVDTEVHRKFGRQASPIEEEEEEEEREEVKPLRPASRAAHHKHGGGGSGGPPAAPGRTDGGQDPDALDPDDQLMTLDELAAEVEQQDEKSEEAESDGEAQAGAGQADEDGDGAGDRHGRRRHHTSASDGGDPHSHAATAGGSLAGRHKKSSTGGGVADDASSVGGHAAVGSSGMSRGRRLKRLLKLLSGQKVSRGVSRLRLHVLVVIGLMMLVHTICFMLIIIYINKQQQFITEISAAGEAIDRTFYTAMYTRAIEAATRNQGFSAANIASLESRLASDVDRLEYLHQGLYLGFKDLRRSSDSRLNQLWDAKQWNVTEYQDTKVPTFTYALMTLWSLGNDFISAVREVAFYAAANKLLVQDSATASSSTADNSTLLSSPPPTTMADIAGSNITLTRNRFWLYVRDNAGESLYIGYLRVLDTLLLLAQDNISMLKLVIIVLLLVEGCLVCFAAIGYVFWLLWKATRARAALFTVFLVIPQGQLKALASRHITTVQSDSDDEDDEDNGKSKQQRRADDGDRGGSGGGDDQLSEIASVLSGGGGPAAGSGGGARRSIGMAEPPARSSYTGSGGGGSGRKGITFKEEPNKRPGSKASETVLSRIRHAISGEVTVPPPEGGGQARRFFTKKRLTHTTSDIKHLAWPFFAWGAIIIVIYLVSYLQFASVEESLVNLKMFERSTGQAARTMYYVNELALEADSARQAVLQPIVAAEASWLDVVYSTTLYGGHTLEDSSAAGAHDENSGSLFTKEHHAQMLFVSKGCMRDSGCLPTNDEFYEVTRHAIDPMMRRLMQEATLLSLDDLADVNASSSRWQYMWTVAQQDLHDGLESLVSSYQSDALAAFKAQGTLHTVVFAVAWVLWALYLWLLLKPYLQISSTETRRVAEMLSQLPTELDVEDMVAESWQVVADTQLDRGGDGKGAKSEPGKQRITVTELALSVFAAVRMASTAARKLAAGKGGDKAAGNQTQPLLKAVDGEYDDDAGKTKARAMNDDVRISKSLSSEGGASLLSAKLKAALKGVGEKGLVIGPDDGDGDSDGGAAAGVDDASDPKAGVKKWRSGGLEDAPQVPVLGSSLFRPSDAAAVTSAVSPRPRSGRGNKISPADSARVSSRPGSGGDAGGAASPRPADGKRPGSAGHSNQVVPMNTTPSGQWFIPDRAGGASAVADAVERPGSGASPSTTATQLGGAEQGAGGSLKSKESNSPYHFNKVLFIRNNNTQYWSEDQPWRPPSGAARRASTESARGGSGGKDRGGAAMASPVVASMAAAAGGSAGAQDEALLPGEIDDPQVAAARRSGANSGSLTGSPVDSERHTIPPPAPPQPLLVDIEDDAPGGAAAAAGFGSGGRGSGRADFTAEIRPASPLAPPPPAARARTPTAFAPPVVASGSRAGTPKLLSPTRSLPPAVAAAAAEAGPQLTPGGPSGSGTPIATTASAPPPLAAAALAPGAAAGAVTGSVSRLGTPAVGSPSPGGNAAVTAAVAAGGSSRVASPLAGSPAGLPGAAAATPSAVAAGSPRLGSPATAAAGTSRPSSRLAGSAANIDLPPAPPPPPLSRPGSASGAAGAAASLPLANQPASLNAAAAAATASAAMAPVAGTETGEEARSQSTLAASPRPASAKAAAAGAVAEAPSSPRAPASPRPQERLGSSTSRPKSPLLSQPVQEPPS